MRLIDSDGLQELFNVTSSALLANPELTKDIEHMVRAFLMVSEMISDAPTIDAVPVVRCKDCKECEERHTANLLPFLYCKLHRCSVLHNFFCCWAERREDEE